MLYTNDDIIAAAKNQAGLAAEYNGDETVQIVTMINNTKIGDLPLNYNRLYRVRLKKQLTEWVLVSLESVEEG